MKWARVNNEDSQNASWGGTPRHSYLQHCNTGQFYRPLMEAVCCISVALCPLSFPIGQKRKRGEQGKKLA